MTTATIQPRTILDDIKDELGQKNLYEVTHELAPTLTPSRVEALWTQHGGDMLYAWALQQLGQERRAATGKLTITRRTGMPIAYSTDPEEYARERYDAILNAYVGIRNKDGKTAQAPIGSLDKEGCEGAFHQYQAQAEGNLREGKRFRRLSKALKKGQRIADLDREVFLQLWFSED